MSCPKQNSLYKTRDKTRTEESVWQYWPETNRHAKMEEGGRWEGGEFFLNNYYRNKESKWGVRVGDRDEKDLTNEANTWEKKDLWQCTANKCGGTCAKKGRRSFSIRHPEANSPQTSVHNFTFNVAHIYCSWTKTNSHVHYLSQARFDSQIDPSTHPIYVAGLWMQQCEHNSTELPSLVPKTLPWGDWGVPSLERDIISPPCSESALDLHWVLEPLFSVLYNIWIYYQMSLHCFQIWIYLIKKIRTI